MMQRLVDDVLGVAKESIKAFSHESFNQTVRLINGFSALVLAVLPDHSSLEGMQGWELRPKLRAPRLPSWMENGVSSFNAFVHDDESDADLDYDSEHESGWDDDSSSLPPSSPCSTISRASSFGRQHHHRRHTLWRRLLRAFFWPLRVFSTRSTSTPAPTPRGSTHGLRSSSSSSGLSRMYHNLYIDRRKGVIEDMQFWMELLIERVFEVVQTLVHYFLSPLKTLKLFLCWIFFGKSSSSGDGSVSSSTLGDANPALQKKPKRQQGLNVDERTCEDVIRDLGYPYEALRVTTDDGFILLLERIPRPQSQKVLYLQHGLLDSSLGWVSNGVVGSQAFAAFDQGYDVFLGNLRGLVSREHVDGGISARKYWNYSVNEHGTQDVAAILAKIHELKTTELQNARSESEQPRYSLCGVAHSLGGASMLMYVVTRRLEAKAHHLSRLVLLSPAGFHEDAPPLCLLMTYLLPVLAPLLAPLLPGLYIPTRFFRGLFNKLARDFHSYPAVGGLVQTFISWFVGGDPSNWVGVLGMSHYNMNDMPGLALKVAVHLAQMMSSARFRMFDFGSAEANLRAYGTREPLDIGAHYGVIDIPVDVVAGRRDKLIPPSMVKRHFHTLKRAGCQASYDEFEYAHLDFTMSNKEELQAYVMSRLLLVTPPSHKMTSRKSVKKPRIVLTDENAPSTYQSALAPINLDTTVTAGSMATQAHEETSTSSPPYPPHAEDKFYDSSLFAFPSKEVVSVMSLRGGIVTRATTVAAKDSRSSKLAKQLSR